MLTEIHSSTFCLDLPQTSLLNSLLNIQRNIHNKTTQAVYHTCHWELLTCWPSPQSPWSPAIVLCHFLLRFLSYFLLCFLSTLPIPINFISIHISLHLFPTALSDWATEALYGQTHPGKYVPEEGFSVFDLWLIFYYLSISSNSIFLPSTPIPHFYSTNSP